MQERPKNKFISASPLSPNDCNILLKRKKAQFTLDEFCAWDEPGDTCIGDLGSIFTKFNPNFHITYLIPFMFLNYFLTLVKILYSGMHCFYV